MLSGAIFPCFRLEQNHFPVLQYRMSKSQNVPVVLIFSGLDPSGGAGIQADVETLASHGCHAAPVITALTAQDTSRVFEIVPVSANLLIEQARAVLEDMPVTTVKIGLLGSVATVEVIHSILRDYPNIPVVLDPVLASGGDDPMSNQDIVDAMRSLLFPISTVLTPNSPEARKLAPQADNLQACAMELLDNGCEFVLITGTHEPGEEVINTLYGNHRKLEEFHWPRLPDHYHGSGCTLASSIAGLLAHGNEPMIAIHEAQQYTWESLKNAYRVGMGQAIPNRLFWARTQ